MQVGGNTRLAAEFCTVLYANDAPVSGNSKMRRDPPPPADSGPLAVFARFCRGVEFRTLSSSRWSFRV